jgi:hypothetical protein
MRRRRWPPMRSPALLLSSLQNFVSGSIESASSMLVTLESFSRRHVTELWNPNSRPNVLSSDCKLEGRAMRNFSRGIWTCAALYVALGLIGILFLTSEPRIATSSEGYGIAATASPTPLR